MSEFTLYYEAVQSGSFSDPDPKACGCRGSGWFLSELDTWHACPEHNDGQPCPDYDEPEFYAEQLDRYNKAKAEGTDPRKVEEEALAQMVKAGAESMSRFEDICDGDVPF
jgi:hypothetical protein